MLSTGFFGHIINHVTKSIVLTMFNIYQIHWTGLDAVKVPSTDVKLTYNCDTESS